MDDLNYEQAFERALAHVDSMNPIDPDYRLIVGRCGDCDSGWYFDYRVEPLRELTEDEQQQFGGAPGFVVDRRTGDTMVVSWEGRRKIGLGPLRDSAP